jgi:hypothetical protein
MRNLLLLPIILVTGLLSACSAEDPASAAAIPAAAPVQQSPPASAVTPFTIAVIPDTQNYVSFKTEKNQGFAIDASELFIAQMRDIASRATAQGGDLVFAAAVGDVWQHQTLNIDAKHKARGQDFVANPFFASELAPTQQTLAVEIPRAIEGYQILAAAGIPFGVAPGNHDYDAMWSAAGFPPNLAKPPAELTMTPEDLGILHIGGLDNFRSVFGDYSDFFRDKPWYVSSFRGGANGAQVFEGGGYEFLHITLEMAASDEVLAWAQSVIDAHPGKPTIITTHDYLDTQGRRQANPIVDLKRIDPDHHNTAEEVWSELISPNDQVFLVLCGHHHGQSMRVDNNAAGHPVYQVLADYQGRGQAGLDAGQPRNGRGGVAGLGDGWYRLMTFDMSQEPQIISVGTWSSHYKTFSDDLYSYADWYKKSEHPLLTDPEFHAMDDFEIELKGFQQRFGPPRP